MSRVDFYLLPDVDTEARRRFACRLAYKAWVQGSPVHVRVDDAAAAADLDALMWEYPAEQFLPHAREDDEDARDAPVVIGWREDPPAGAAEGLLINLSRALPAGAARWARVAEIVVAPDRDLGRQRWREYRQHGLPLFHHDLEDWEA